MINNRLPVTGAILAGGQSSRMNGRNKGLIMLNGRPLYQHVLHALQPQVNCIVINANRDLDCYRKSGLLVIPDTQPEHTGPLAGILTRSDWVAFAPCDTPWLPDDWVVRLWEQKHFAPAVWLRSAERDHPALLLIDVAAKHFLSDFLNDGGRKLITFLLELGGHAVQLDDEEYCFANINTPEDLVWASINAPGRR